MAEHSAPSSINEPRWRRLPEERPRQILDAALEVFGERGLAATRLEDVARRAGVSKGTIYLYFQSKEDLFREVVRQTVVSSIERGEEAARQPTASVTEAMRALIRGYWAFGTTPQYANLYRLVIAELHNFPDLARFYADEVMSRGAALITSIIERGIAAGEFRPMEPRAAARMLIALVLSHALWLQNRDFFSHVCDRPDETVLAELMDFYFHALRPDTKGHDA